MLIFMTSWRLVFYYCIFLYFVYRPKISGPSHTSFEIAPKHLEAGEEIIKIHCRNAMHVITCGFVYDTRTCVLARSVNGGKSKSPKKLSSYRVCFLRELYYFQGVDVCVCVSAHGCQNGNGIRFRAFILFDKGRHVMGLRCDLSSWLTEKTNYSPLFKRHWVFWVFSGVLCVLIQSFWPHFKWGKTQSKGCWVLQVKLNVISRTKKNVL